MSSDFTCEEIIEIFCEFFQFPESRIIKSEEIEVSLIHSIAFNGEEIPLSKSLKEAGIENNDIITYITTMLWREMKREFRGDVMNMITGPLLSHLHSTGSRKTLEQRLDAAHEKYDAVLRDCYQKFDEQLSEN
ncbi:hypothetical protein [Azospirillum sp.]|uniref:hypothetical protein n=1 Tax=Azospirillum sp. TaxID=34012 RepID=UPI002D3A4AD6|nr:hypothetical protein [Azospirillum sp.]HYD67708.1 hypothetical protein [Azospirillum sp.]